MKLKKIDLSGLKSYLFQKGERIGLVICALIGLLLLGVGLMKAGGSSLPYAETLKKAAVDMERRMNVPEVAEMKIAAIDPKTLKGWDLNNKDFDSTPWINVIKDFEDNKRQNPVIYKVQDDDKHLQIDRFRGGYFAYELELKDEKVWAFDKAVPGGNDSGPGGPSRLVKIMKPARFVVVTGVFPWKDQMEEFRRKLHYGTMAELVVKPEDMPKPLGLNVYRCEVLAGGKEYSKWETIFKWDGEKLEKAQRIEDLFREAIIDVDNPGMLTTGKHLHSGLVTPLPELANPNLHYPKLNLQGIKQDETKKGKTPQRNQGKGRGSIFGPQSAPKKGPPGRGGTQQEVKMSREPWTKFPQPLQDQFSGKIGWFDPYGIAPESAQANMANIGFQGQKFPNKDDKIELEDVVVRFVDVNVEPGKTYMYTFAVRMANPNFGKTKDVAFASLADDKELLSEYTTTPPVSIPGEYYYYAVDQKPDQQIPGGSDTKPAVADYPTAYGKWTTPVQVHRWLGKTDDKEKVVADWAIAERLLTRRGDTIGRYEVMTEVPVWDKAKEDFEIGVKYLNNKANAKKANTGLPIDYIQPADRARPPLLVDFEGGWKTAKIGSASVRDESAVDMLVLTPSGKLEVRNSRNDTDLDNPVAQDRHTRWENWLKGIRNMHNPGGGNAMPGG